MVLQGEKYADPLSGGKAPSGTAQAHSPLFHPKSGEYKLSAGNGTTGKYARRRRQAQKTGGFESGESDACRAGRRRGCGVDQQPSTGNDKTPRNVLGRSL